MFRPLTIASLLLPLVVTGPVLAECTRCDRAGWLGVMLRDGAVAPTIAEVVPGSPADLAGLRPGDVLVSLGGRGVVDVDDVVTVMGTTRPGQALRVEVRRGEEVIALDATLAERPDATSWAGIAPSSPDARAGRLLLAADSR